MNTDQELINLPPNWTIEYSATVGFSCLDAAGNIIAQHSRDDNAFRKGCWHIFYEQLALDVAKLRRKTARRATATDRAIVEHIVCVMMGEAPQEGHG